MPNKKLNYFKMGDLLKTKKERTCTVQTNYKHKSSSCKKGTMVVFLSSKLHTKMSYHYKPNGDYIKDYTAFIKVMDEGQIKIFNLNFEEVYQVFKLVQKS